MGIDANFTSAHRRSASSPATGDRTPRFKLLLLFVFVGSLALVWSVDLVAWLTFDRGPATERLERHERMLRGTFQALLEEAAGLADSALAVSPERAWSTAQSRGGGMGPRLEGVGTLDAQLRFETWRGAPVDPPPSFADASWPRFSVQAGGARTRLLVRAGPDATGRTALATFILDSIPGDDRFAALLPSALQHAQLDVTFHDTAAAFPPAQPARESPDERRLELRSPQGDLLAGAQLGLLPAYRHKRLQHHAAGSWTLVLSLGLLALWFPWAAACRSFSGFGAAVGAVVAGRLALVFWNAPARILPRGLGAPTLYGSSSTGDLLASPADFALTGLALLLVGLAARIACAEALRRRGRPAVLAAGAAALVWTSAAAGLVISLARDSRVDLLASPAPFEAGPRLLLWSGLLLALIGAAELWALATVGLAGRSAEARPGAVALALVLLVAAASALLQRETERIAVEQLRSDYAPLVLDQGSRRKLALTGAMADVECAAAEADTGEGLPVEYLAYRQWVAGELFHSRYKSSLDFYSPSGEFVSHFGFGLPPLDEHFDPGLGVLHEPKQESIRGVAAEPRLLHAEAAVNGPQGDLLGFVVGHVLDEPENLPFLPWAQPYLAALGPGPRAAAERGAGPPQYVLYDATGVVELTTLLRPPAHDPALRRTARRAGTAHVLAGDEPHLALPVEEPAGRLHLLLLAERTVAERLAAAVRPALLGLALLFVVRFPLGLLRHHGVGGLADLIRGSLRRKILAAVLLASVVPLIGLALFLRAHVERRADAELIASATRTVITAQRVIEDYAVPSAGEAPPELNDSILHWLKRVAGQEIQLYADGRLQATSMRELFDSGLLPPRLDGEVRRRLVDEGLPYLVTSMTLGLSAIPVAYAPIHPRGSIGPPLVVAVPLVLEERQIERAAGRVGEMILLATVALAGLLGVVAAALARTVAEPVRGLVEATRRIAAGDYATRLRPATRDEVSHLVSGFNTMASALGLQRHDLERRRDYIETVLRHATAGVISLDPEGKIVTLNPAASGLLRSCSERLQLGLSLREALASAGDLGPLTRALFDPPPPSGEPIEVDLARSPEPRRWRAVRVELSDRGERLGTLILLDDVTELMRSNQLAAWAEMARAIAHEIKNPLTPIQLSAEHLRRLLADRGLAGSSAEHECVETIVKQVRALRDIARDFSTYAKLPILAPEPTDPVAFLRETLAPYRTSCPAGLRIEERYAEAPNVPMDRRVLARAVINLVENALEAMPGGGTLDVAVDFDRAARAVLLSVADSGPGLAPDVRRRLFEPYFSTKSSGTGLGLAIARRAVEAHGGTIEVETESGQGTTFRIRIPLPAPAEGDEAPRPGYTPTL